MLTEKSLKINYLINVMIVMLSHFRTVRMAQSVGSTPSPPRVGIGHRHDLGAGAKARSGPYSHVITRSRVTV